MSVDIAFVNAAQKRKKIKLLNRKIEIEKNKRKIELKIKSKLNQNIGMSVFIAVKDTAQKK